MEEEKSFALVRKAFEEMRAASSAAFVETQYSLHDPEICEGADDFSITAENGKITFASGCIRGLFYAVYEYFERYCSCRYFYDGDIIPQRKTLPAENIRFVKHFRYHYRGIRYFAHRSLYRFQAEHWNLEDWKKEIDFLLKKHFSFFMLRTGQIDLFQKAFPEIVPYPPEDGPAPEAVLRSYNDRTELISLQYRGELQKKVLSYAFERGLMHPEDMGPMTHWYSHTPKAFLEKIKPEFMGQTSKNYAREELQVWNCDDDQLLEYYMTLTKAHIRHYGKGELFHIIGLAERVFGSEKENFEIKKRTFFRFVRRLRQEYPHAPLLVASWDFMFRWKAREVREFIRELDPANTLILDYTTDSYYYANNFISWNLPHHFPWIFGIFQAFEPQADLFFDFEGIEEMYIPVQDDPQCKGMVLWSENSHSNPLLTEYLTKRFCGEEFSLARFCRDRYGEKYAGNMQELWELTREPFSCNSWCYSTVKDLLYPNHFHLLSDLAKVSSQNPSRLCSECERRYPILAIPEVFFEKAAALAQETIAYPLIQRDLGDLIRSALMCLISREMCGNVKKLCTRNPEKADFTLLLELVKLMGGLLETLPEHSLSATLEKTAQSGKLNSHGEMTLKGNAENNYCRSYIYELYSAIYIPEAECAAAHLAELPPGVYPDKEYLKAQEEKIREEFYRLPLCAFAPRPALSFARFAAAISEKLSNFCSGSKE